MTHTTKVTQGEAALHLYNALNSPVKAGRVWVQYKRDVVDAALVVLKQMLAAQGYEFRPHGWDVNKHGTDPFSDEADI